MTFEATDESLSAVAQLIAKESVCCSSVTFELSYEPPYDMFSVTITGPEGTRDLLERGFLEEFDSASVSDRWLAGSGILDAELPTDMQAALGQLIGDDAVETLRAWVSVIREHTDGHAMAIDDLCHAAEQTDHWAEMAGETYHFMCFYDAVVMAAMADEPVDIRTESPGGTVITAQAAGSDQLTVMPSDTVFSLGVATDTGPSTEGELSLEDVYSAVCPYVKAFPDREAYEEWAADVEAATVAMPLDGATHVASVLID